MEEARFHGPATNCIELSKLGYTLNGYYLVSSGSNNETPSSQKKKESNNGPIRVVECRFRQPIGKNKSNQKTS